MTLLRSLVPAAALLFAFVAPAPAQEITLKQQWLPGKKYFQTMTVEQTNKVALGDQSMDQKTVQKMDLVTTVAPHEDGKRLRLGVTHTRLVLDMDMMGQKQHFDTDEKTESAADPFGLGKLLGALVGKELRIVVTADGKIEDVENMDVLLKDALGGSPLGSMLGGLISKDSMSTNLQQASLLALPAKAVKPGDTWPFTTGVKMPPMGSIAIKGDYTYKGTATDAGVKCAEIAVAGKLSVDLNLDELGKAVAKDKPAPDGSAAEKPPIADLLSALGMKLKGGDYKGRILFDNALGIARESAITQSMTMTMTSPTDGQPMNIPMTQVLTTKLTKVEDTK